MEFENKWEINFPFINRVAFKHIICGEEILIRDWFDVNALEVRVENHYEKCSRGVGE